MKKYISTTNISLTILAAAALAVATLPYTALKQFGNFFTPDGNLERLTEANSLYFRLFFIFSFVFFTGVLLWGIWDKEGRRRFFIALREAPKKSVSDIRPFFLSFKNEINKSPKLSLAAISVIMLFGALLRFLLLDRPLLHDEAYTIAAWGRGDLLYAVSDYHLPNNHLFNTLLINLIYKTGAKAAWFYRLPVFISGVLVIFFTWLLAKALYRSNFAAAAAAGFAAFHPFLVDYSVNARGYEIQALFTVISVCLALYAKRKGNLFSWALLALISSLNFFVIPTSLYPFGGICLWLLIEGIHMKGKERNRVLTGIVLTGISVFILTSILYTPLLMRSGFRSLFGNIFVKPVDAEIFLPTLLSRIKETVDIFFGSIPRFSSIMILIGFLFSLLALKSYSDEHISPVSAMILFLIIVIPFQRPNLWPRTLLYLYPLLILSSAAGLAWLGADGSLRIVTVFAVGIAVAYSAAPQFISAAGEFGCAGAAEKAVWHLIAHEGKNAENVYIATVSEDNAPLWVYADFYGLPKKIFDRSKPFNTVYVFVNQLNDTEDGVNTLEEVLALEGPGDQFIDFDSKKILLLLQRGILYRYDANKDLVQKEYLGISE